MVKDAVLIVTEKPAAAAKIAAALSGATDEKIKEIFELLGLNIVKIAKIETLSNFVAKIESNNGNYFLKIYDNEEEAMVGHKLFSLYPLLLRKKIPVPKVMKFDYSLKLINHPYLVFTEIKGKAVSESIEKMGHEERESFFYEFGKMVANIHSITFDKFGETFDGKSVGCYSEANKKGPFSSWKDMHKEMIAHRLSVLENSYFEDLIKPIRLWFENNKHLVDYNVVPRLLHDDLNQKNIFLKDSRISGIIDFDNAFVGHNEEELMRIEIANFLDDENSKRSFFRGYTEIIKLDDNYEQRRKYYYLSRMLVHIDCIIEYGDSYADVRREQEVARKEICEIIDGK